MGEFNKYKLGREKAEPGKKLSDDYARELRHGYLAAVSYIDAQVGKLLDALDKNGLSQNTVVILWGDHGWHLGDHTIWGKHTLYERSLRSPLIISLPGHRPAKGKIEYVVETVDIYPTITGLAGLPRPAKLSGVDLLSEYRKLTAARSFWRNSVSLRDERFRIIVHGARFPEDVELYDHHNDPEETRNVVDRFPKEARRLFENARHLELENEDS